MTKKNNTHEDTYGAIIVCVSQEEILSHDHSNIRSVFSRLDAELIPAERNSVKIVVPLPDSEKRELVEIPEVRAFFARLFDEVDSLFYWLDPNDNSFWLMPFYLQENSTAIYRLVRKWFLIFRVFRNIFVEDAKNWRYSANVRAFLPRMQGIEFWRVIITKTLPDSGLSNG